MCVCVCVWGGDGGVYTHACMCAFNLCCCIKVLVYCLFYFYCALLVNFLVSTYLDNKYSDSSSYLARP